MVRLPKELAHVLCAAALRWPPPSTLASVPRLPFPRNDNLNNYAYVGNGNGTTPPEQYLAFHANNIGNTINPIKPGETTLLQNVQTGMVSL
jgi:hypothetical protein